MTTRTGPSNAGRSPTFGGGPSIEDVPGGWSFENLHPDARHRIDFDGGVQTLTTSGSTVVSISS